MKFKYLIINNGRQYLVNSLEEYFSRGNYHGESLNIEMAPKDGWFDSNGRRCAMSFGKEVVLANWEYTREYSRSEKFSMAAMATHPWYLVKEHIVLLDVVQGAIASVSPCGALEANIRIDGDEAEVMTFYKEWRNIIG